MTAAVGHARKYVSVGRVSLEVIFAYRAGFVLNMVGSVFYVVAMFYLWQTIFANNPRALGGFSWPEMKAYLLVAFLMNSLMTWYDEWVMGMDIKQGRVAIDLSRPMDFQASRFAYAIGSVPFELLAALVVGFVVAFAFGGVALPPDGLHAGLFVLSAALGALIKFGVIYTVSMCAFWTTGLDGLVVGRVAIQNIFSGALIPLVFFPDWLRAVSAVLPFQGMVSTPALTFLGKLDTGSALVAIGVQLAWVVGLIVLSRLLWRRAVRAVTIHGG